MKNFWKKAGWLAITILPFVSCMVLQFGIGMLSMLPASFMAGINAAKQGITDQVQIQNYIQEAIMDSAPIGVLAYHIVSLPVFGLWYYFGCGRPKASNPFKILRPVMMLRLIVCGFGLSTLSYGLMGLLQYLTPDLIEQYAHLVESAGIGVNWMTIIATVILAPIGEELLCRGLTLHYAMKVTQGLKNRNVSFWIANTIQALLFGIMHFNFVQGLYAFFIGLILGGLTYSFKSLYPAIFVHFVVNILGSFVMPYLMDQAPEHALTWTVVLVTGILITAAALYRRNRKEPEAA